MESIIVCCKQSVNEIVTRVHLNAASVQSPCHAKAPFSSLGFHQVHGVISLNMSRAVRFSGFWSSMPPTTGRLCCTLCCESPQTPCQRKQTRKKGNRAKDVRLLEGKTPPPFSPLDLRVPSSRIVRACVPHHHQCSRHQHQHHH